MTQSVPTTGPARSHPTPWPQALGVAAALSLVVGVILLLFAWPAVTAVPQNLPVGIVGADAQVAQIEAMVAQNADGALAFIRYDTREDAVSAIARRESYGALVLGAAAAPEVLTASAASATAAQLLDGLAQGLQSAVAAQDPAAMVTVTDVVPFAASDPRGAGLGVALFPLLLGGLAVGIVSTLVIRGSAVRRATTVVVAALGAGLVLAAILQGLFGALQGSSALNAAACAVTVAAIAATVTGCAGLLGPAGVGVGAAFTMLVANPLSAAAVPVEFLPDPWGAIGQFLPPGAAATLLRSLSYFPAAPTAPQWSVLVLWSVIGLALTLVDLPGRRQRARARVTAV